LFPGHELLESNKAQKLVMVVYGNGPSHSEVEIGGYLFKVSLCKMSESSSLKNTLGMVIHSIITATLEVVVE
jgi:hypothetical protein